MAPKKKGTKKGKNPLSRGRPVKQETMTDETATTTASETDENTADYPNSPVGDNDKNGDSDKEALTTVPEETADVKDENEESWEDIPSLIEDLRLGGQGKVKYVTSKREHREFELDARKSLLQLQFDLDNMKSTMDLSLSMMRKLHPEVRNGKLCDLVKTLGCPTSFKDLVVRLVTSPIPLVQVNEPIFEESETEVEDAVVGIPYIRSQQNFPSPAKMAKYTTPKQDIGGNRIFQFGTHTKGLSTNKAARLPKPGEVVYSESGSPILSRRVPEVTSSQAVERVEIVEPDGSKYEVEIVYRGGHGANKLREFKEFTKDVRGMAASRSTTVRQNRVQPPKIVKTGSQSVSKVKTNKPEWR